MLHGCPDELIEQSKLYQSLLGKDVYEPSVSNWKADASEWKDRSDHLRPGHSGTHYRANIDLLLLDT